MIFLMIFFVFVASVKLSDQKSFGMTIESITIST